MEKQRIVDEFLKGRQTKTENIAKVEVPAPIVENELPKKIIKKNKWKNKKNKKNFNKIDIINENVLEDNEFSKIKSEYLEKEEFQNFQNFLEDHKKTGASVFEFDFFLKHKIKEPSIKTIIIDPSIDDISRGVKNRFYLVRPLYINEYTEFKNQFGKREENDEKFMKFMIEKTVIYPEGITAQQIEVMPTGTLLSLYTTVLDMSDLNKSYRILEV